MCILVHFIRYAEIFTFTVDLLTVFQYFNISFRFVSARKPPIAASPFDLLPSTTATVSTTTTTTTTQKQTSTNIPHQKSNLSSSTVPTHGQKVSEKKPISNKCKLYNIDSIVNHSHQVFNNVNGEVGPNTEKSEKNPNESMSVKVHEEPKLITKCKRVEHLQRIHVEDGKCGSVGVPDVRNRNDEMKPIIKSNLSESLSKFEDGEDGKCAANIPIHNSNKCIKENDDNISVVCKNPGVNTCKNFERNNDNNSDRLNTYKYSDLSSEVKHARTPLDITSDQQTHSPQLPPIPSPNYPVQTQLSITDVTTAVTNNNNNPTTIHTHLNQSTHAARLPNNTYVPTIVNNNYIKKASNATSQTDVSRIDYVPRSIIDSHSSEECQKGDEYLIANSHKTVYVSKEEAECSSGIPDIKMLNTNDELINYDITNGYKEVTFESSKTEHKSLLDSVGFCDKLNVVDEEVQDEMKPNNKDGLTTVFTVLNVPNVSFQPPIKRQKLSKIDLAMMKRKMRRRNKLKQPYANKDEERLSHKRPYAVDYGVQVYGYSDSSESSTYTSSDCDSDSLEIDVRIMSGPPLKLDVSPEKMEFLNMFGLTSHKRRNCKCRYKYLICLFRTYKMLFKCKVTNSILVKFN